MGDKAQGFAIGALVMLALCSVALNYALYTEKLVKNTTADISGIYLDGIKGVAKR